MKTLLTLIPGTDAFYNVRVLLLGKTHPVFLGQVKKVYLTRTTTGWTLAPRDYEERGTTRLGECKRTSLVEG